MSDTLSKKAEQKREGRGGEGLKGTVGDKSISWKTILYLKVSTTAVTFAPDTCSHLSAHCPSLTALETLMFEMHFFYIIMKGMTKEFEKFKSNPYNSKITALHVCSACPCSPGRNINTADRQEQLQSYPTGQ